MQLKQHLHIQYRLKSKYGSAFRKCVLSLQGCFSVSECKLTPVECYMRVLRCCWCTGSLRSRGCCFIVEVEVRICTSVPRHWLSSWQSLSQDFLWPPWWLCMRTARFSLSRPNTYSRCVFQYKELSHLFLAYRVKQQLVTSVFVCLGAGLRELPTGGFLGGDAHGLFTGSCHSGAAVPFSISLHRKADQHKLRYTFQSSTHTCKTQVPEEC